MSELTSRSISELRAVLQSREASVTEAISAHLRRIAAVDDVLHSFVATVEAQAMRRANELDRLAAETGTVGPLHGVPIGLKDLIETQGVRTTMGSSVFEDYVPSSDAVVVRRLEAAGAVVVGKQNMDELALGVIGSNPLFPTSNNPWSRDRITGGSSGGSAAAVAAGLCMGSIGSDTAGSIRVPASLCGVVGLKPTYGRVSTRGVLPLSWTLDHVGPMARSASDVRALFEAIEGYDVDDPTSVDSSRISVERPPSDVKGWRVALAHDGFFTPVQPEISKALEAAAEVFSKLGARVETVRMDIDVPRGIVSSEGGVLHRDRLEANPEKFGVEVRTMLRKGLDRPLSEYADGRRRQILLRRQFERLFADVDLLLTPTTTVVAPRHGSADARALAQELTSLTGPFNLAGMPAVSVPCGLSSEGLPIGLQIVGPHWHDSQVLQAAEAFESIVSLPQPEVDTTGSGGLPADQDTP